MPSLSFRRKNNKPEADPFPRKSSPVRVYTTGGWAISLWLILLRIFLVVCILLLSVVLMLTDAFLLLWDRSIVPQGLSGASIGVGVGWYIRWLVHLFVISMPFSSV